MTEKYIEEIDFQLSRELPYANKGEACKAKELILKAPASKHRRVTTKLRKFFFVAMLDMSDRHKDSDNKEVEGQEAQEMTSDGVMQLLYACPDIDVGECQDLLRELLLNGCGYLDLETKLTAPSYDGLLDRDLERLFGEFFLNFLFTKPKE